MSDLKIYRANTPSGLIMREDENGQSVEGMVVPYGTWSEVDSVIEGHFLERFAAGSLKKTFEETLRRAKGYFEHGRSKMFDRTPIMEVTRTWEQPGGAWVNASLLRGLPEWMVDGIARGLYGFSLGADVMQVERNEKPGRSAHNPDGIEERTYTELRAYDISLTPSPHYSEATAVLRSITDELAIEKLVQQPERLLQLLRETQEAEPTHSVPEAAEVELPEPPTDPEQVEETEPEEKDEELAAETPEPQPQGSRDTQPPHDYLSEDEEEAWQL